jgi:hypothetical protein
MSSSDRNEKIFSKGEMEKFLEKRKSYVRRRRRREDE